MNIRLQKFLAKASIASRRKSEQLIKQGKVSVNGKTVTKMGTIIDDKKDIVEYMGKKINIDNEKVYLLLNKPEGYVTTVHDQFNRPNVIDLIHGINQRVYPVGRLDYNTSGLLLITNDGDLTYRITHPKHNINKKYLAVLNNLPNEMELDKLRLGVIIDGYKTSRAIVNIIDKNKKKLEIIIHEGRNRQVRKMVQSIGYKVCSLKRTAIGEITLDNLKKGEFRHLTKDEVQYLKK